MGSDKDYDWLDKALDKIDDEVIDSMREYDDKKLTDNTKEKKTEKIEKTKTVQKELPIIDNNEVKKPGKPKSDSWILTPKVMMEKISKQVTIKHYNGNFYSYLDRRYNNRYKGEPVEIYLGMKAEDMFYEIKDRDKNLKNDTSTNYIKEMCGHFARTHHVFDEDIDRNLIGVKNGILNIEKYPYEIMRPDPSLFTAINLPIKYDPNIITEDLNFKKFERDILIKKFIDEDGNFYDKDSRKTLDLQVQLLEEMFGYTLEYGYPIKKAVLLLGPPNCGKTTFYRIMDAFLGLDNVSSVSLYDLGDKNRPAEMVGKLVNNVADIGYNVLERRTIENFMNYTGGEGKITVEKKYRDPFQYMPFVKMYFGANFTPYVNLSNNPFLGRWTIIKFPDNDFPFDGNFIYGLTTEREKSGILNLALEGLMRIRKNRDFSFKQNLRTIKKLFKDNRQPNEDDSDEKPRQREERSDKGKNHKQRKDDIRRIGDEDVVNVGG